MSSNDCVNRQYIEVKSRELELLESIAHYLNLISKTFLRISERCQDRNLPGFDSLSYHFREISLNLKEIKNGLKK